ncbi:MAG: hypothetical protein SGI77_14975 [Pirellulaceae bacterium]|nr:hypothetical protein [Pirellulaceae bacterium]
MKDIAVPIAILVAWIALNVWVLPMFGIRTCLSGSCGTKQSSPEAEDTAGQENKAPDQK